MDPSAFVCRVLGKSMKNLECPATRVMALQGCRGATYKALSSGLPGELGKLA